MTDTAPHNEPKLAHFPVTFFAAVMGMAGLTLATHIAEVSWGVPAVLSVLLLLVTIGIFVMIFTFFALKWRRHRAHFLAEWNHPVKRRSFPRSRSRYC